MKKEKVNKKNKILKIHFLPYLFYSYKYKRLINLTQLIAEFMLTL